MSKHPIHDELSCPNCKRIANWASIRVYKNSASIMHIICSCGQSIMIITDEESNMLISATVHSELINGEWKFVAR